MGDSLRNGARIFSPRALCSLMCSNSSARERPRLVQDGLPGADLADVVQLAAEPDVLEQLADVAQVDAVFTA